MWHCRSQQLLGLQGELLLHYVRRITSFWTDSQWRNVTIRLVLVCTIACAAWLNEFYGWIKHGPSVDQFFRLLHSLLSLNGPGYPSPWRCPGRIPTLLGWRMCKAHPKSYRAAFLKCLACELPRTVTCSYLKTFFSWRALWNANLYFSNPERFQPGFTVLWLCTLLLLPCFSNKVCFLFAHYRTPFSWCCRSLVPSVHPSSTAGVASPSCPWDNTIPGDMEWHIPAGSKKRVGKELGTGDRAEHNEVSHENGFSILHWFLRITKNTSFLPACHFPLVSFFLLLASGYFSSWPLWSHCG